MFGYFLYLPSWSDMFGYIWDRDWEGREIVFVCSDAPRWLSVELAQLRLLIKAHVFWDMCAFTIRATKVVLV